MQPKNSRHSMIAQFYLVSDYRTDNHGHLSTLFDGGNLIKRSQTSTGNALIESNVMLYQSQVVFSSTLRVTVMTASSFESSSDPRRMICRNGFMRLESFAFLLAWSRSTWNCTWIVESSPFRQEMNLPHQVE